jgi:hypothetical protein
MAYFISKGITLKMGNMPIQGVATYVTEWMGKNEELNGIFPNLQEIGEISFAGAGGSYDQIEVTTLADNRHMYTNGLIADSETSANELTFKFLYDPELFKLFKNMMAAEELEGSADKHNEWIVTIPEGGTFTIAGDIASLTMDSVATNSALTFVLAIAVDSIEIA